MRIPYFAQFTNKYASAQQLNGRKLVFDGRNYFYWMYKNSKSQYIFGCECDNYREYLIKQLNIFAKANVKCYFIFGRGCKSEEKRPEKRVVKKFEPTDDTFVPPIFMWEIHREVLEEMGFKYTVCAHETKTECIALAQKLGCPIVSYDVEFCLYSVPYISSYTLNFDENKQVLSARVFELNRFINQLRINEEKLAIFVALMDEKKFPAKYFDKSLHFLRLPAIPEHEGMTQAEKKETGALYVQKYGKVFKWLADTSVEQATNIISGGVSPDDQAKFLKAKDDMNAMIRRKESPGFPSEYLANECQLEITENDPFWFEKGVVTGRIPLVYVKLYRSSIIFESYAIANHDAQNPLSLSSEIIKYSFNLLTNFQKESFIIRTSQWVDVGVPATSEITRPVYEAKESVFENGWENIQSLGLFEHFLTQAIPKFEEMSLDEVPEDARLLIIGFLYYKRYSKDDLTDAIVASVLLSYISLGVIEEPQSNDTNNNKNKITETDKKKTIDLLSEYKSPVDDVTARQMFDLELIHPFVEFQRCLDHLGFLNKLCGAPYKPIAFSKVINGTFVYKVLHAIVQEHQDDYHLYLGFLTEKLKSVPSVLAFVEGFLKIYRQGQDFLIGALLYALNCTEIHESIQATLDYFGIQEIP